MIQTRRIVPALAVFLSVLGSVVWAQPAPKTAVKPKLEDLDGAGLAALVKGFLDNKSNRTSFPAEKEVSDAGITFEYPKKFNYNKADKTLTITRAKDAPAINDTKMTTAIGVVLLESLVQADAISDKPYFDPWWKSLKVTFKTEDGPMPDPKPKDPVVTTPCPPTGTVTYSVVTTSHGCCLSLCCWGKKPSYVTSHTVVTISQPTPYATTAAGCGTVAQATPFQTFAPAVVTQPTPAATVVTTSVAIPSASIAVSSVPAVPTTSAVVAPPSPALEVVVAKRRPVVPKEELLRGKDREQAINLYSRGACCYIDGDYEQALAYLEAATTLNDKDARFWYFLSLTQLQLNQSVAAREAATIGAALEFLDPEQKRPVGLSLERIQGTLRKQLQEASTKFTDVASATACLAKKSSLATAAK